MATAPLTDLMKCPHCGVDDNIAGEGLFADHKCTHCGRHFTAHNLLANFRLTGVLGYGGMSTVYRAEDLVLGRPVAIKVLSGDYQDAPESRARFERECSHMAKVRHRNVVSVYSAGWSAGHFYIAMEVAEGRNLEHLLAERKVLLPHEALEIVRQVAHGLQAALAVGVLHRDIKPGNVIIAPGGLAKVLDFGLAQDSSTEGQKEGIIWATPFYVPPETLRREPEDARSDIYALGMTLRNLLTGVDTLGPGAEAGLEEMVSAKKHLPSFRSTYPKLNEALGDLVDHMTAFAPEDRPAGYTEVLEEIDEVQALVGRSGLRNLTRRQGRGIRLLPIGMVGSAVVGLGLAVLIACSGKVTHRYDPLELPEALRWDDWSAYKKAHSQLATDEAAAAESFAALAEKGKDASVRAAAAWHALLYKPEWRDRLQEQLKAEALPDPLKRLVALDENRRKRQNNPSQAMDELHRLLAEGNGLCCLPLIQRDEVAFEKELPRLLVDIRRRQVREAVEQGRFREAREMLTSLCGELTLSRQERAECAVRIDLCRVAEAMYPFLQKRAGKDFRADATPEQMARWAEGSKLPSAEVRTLVQMLRGDYDAAIRENPYAADAESRKPFAVLMRDWQKRLGK